MAPTFKYPTEDNDKTMAAERHIRLSLFAFHLFIYYTQGNIRTDRNRGIIELLISVSRVLVGELCVQVSAGLYRRTACDFHVDSSQLHGRLNLCTILYSYEASFSKVGDLHMDKQNHQCSFFQSNRNLRCCFVHPKFAVGESCITVWEPCFTGMECNRTLKVY